MAVDFTVTIKSSGGSYTTLSSAESAIDSDISTAVTTSQVFTISEASEAVIADGTAIKGQTSAATGTLLHATTTQAYIISVSGTFQAENIIKTDDSGSTITLDDTGDVIDNCVFECHAQDLDDSVAVNGWTTGTTVGTHGIVFTCPVGQRHDGTDRDLSGQGFKISSSADKVIEIAGVVDSFKMEWLNVEGINQSAFAKTGSGGDIEIKNCVCSRSGTTGNEIAINIAAANEYVLENIILTVANYRGIDARLSTKLTMSHCTTFGNETDSTYGILLDNDNTDVVKNCITTGFVTTNWFNSSGAGRLHRKNATDDTNEAEDTDSPDSLLVVATDEFVAVSSALGTADFHLKTASESEGAGEAGVSTIDIDNDSRDGSTPDIGADEFVAAVGGRIMSSLAGSGGLAGFGGIAGQGGGLAA
jgi:hypothetical protein